MGLDPAGTKRMHLRTVHQRDGQGEYLCISSWLPLVKSTGVLTSLFVRKDEGGGCEVGPKKGFILCPNGFHCFN